MWVAVGVSVGVGDGVKVLVGVTVGVLVGVFVGVGVTVGVAVGVAVGAIDSRAVKWRSKRSLVASSLYWVGESVSPCLDARIL